MHDAKKVFQTLFEDIDGYKISREAQKELETFYIGHTYGEITYDGFSQILKQVEPKHHSIFYDLGSGTGKAVLAAALSGGYSKLRGVELFPAIHAASDAVLRRYFEFLKTRPFTLLYGRDIAFINNDFNSVDFSDADVIFINSTLFEYEIQIPFIQKLQKLKRGSKIITNTYSISAPDFTVQHIGNFPFSWGNEDVFIHQKQ